MKKQIRVATYNIHKCIGMDRKYSPERIAEVLRETDADVIALQEVLCRSLTNKRDHQAEFIAEELGMHYRLGGNRSLDGGEYGNAILSRFPIAAHKNFDITVTKREPRGCLISEIDIGAEQPLRFVNVHMGTSFFERRKQARLLLAAHVLDNPLLTGKRVIAGDFNEWTNGLTTKLFRMHFKSVEPKLHLGKNRTYPGVLPLMHLDHIYFDHGFELKSAFLNRSRKALLASDHLPIIAEFEI